MVLFTALSPPALLQLRWQLGVETLCSPALVVAACLSVTAATDVTGRAYCVGSGNANHEAFSLFVGCFLRS